MTTLENIMEQKIKEYNDAEARAGATVRCRDARYTPDLLKRTPEALFGTISGADRPETPARWNLSGRTHLSAPGPHDLVLVVRPDTVAVVSLTGPALARWVARSLCLNVYRANGSWVVAAGNGALSFGVCGYRPDIIEGDAMAIIKARLIGLAPPQTRAGEWRAFAEGAKFQASGKTPMEAAMRALVLSEYGETVPTEEFE